MQRNRLATVCSLVAIGLIGSGCGKESRPQIEASQDGQRTTEEPKPPDVLPGQNTGTYVPIAPAPQTWGTGEFAAEQTPMSLAPVAVQSPQDKYNAALLDALNLTADRKYAQALGELESARAIQDTDQVRQQIDRLKVTIDQQSALERTVHDIQTVLDAGKAEEASRLASAGLQQFGGTDAAESLTRLRQQAEALLAAQSDDKSAHRNRLRLEAEAALKDKNLRAASIALEQALGYGEDPELRRQFDDVRSALTRYDDNRRRACELRRDPANLEDAIAALQEAARAWDTYQVHEEIDEYTLALQRRRDRISVADFEVRGEVGVPAVGCTVAEELLPAFKSRFDLVERSQLVKVVEELKLEAGDLAGNDSGCREVGRLANVRYLVLGSVTPMSGITVQARLVEVKSGLIVQSARIVGQSPDDLHR
jgi:hypothetical protein